MDDDNIIFDGEATMDGENPSMWNMTESLPPADAARHTDLAHRIAAARSIN
jgi:hypothetical protein